MIDAWKRTDWYDRKRIVPAAGLCKIQGATGIKAGASQRSHRSATRAPNLSWARNAESGRSRSNEKKQNELAKSVFDTAENDPSKIVPLYFLLPGGSKSARPRRGAVGPCALDPMEMGGGESEGNRPGRMWHALKITWCGGGGTHSKTSCDKKSKLS